jgi:hypothetical protein
MDEKDGCICLGDHGLAFDLAGGGTLGVFADYAAELDEPTLADILKAALNRMTDLGEGRTAHIDSVKPTTLKGRRGYIVKARDVSDDDTSDSFLRIEYIFDSGIGRVDIYLHSSTGTSQQDGALLKQLLDSWKWASNNRIERPRDR